MPSDTLVEQTLSLPDIDAVLPCAGITYTEDSGGGFSDPCSNPAEWTRLGHCTPDQNFCDPCKKMITEWSRHGWVRCLTCSAIVWPEQLNWRRL